MRITRPQTARRGFNLLEVLVGLSILTAGVLAIAAAFPLIGGAQRDAELLALAAGRAQQKAEEIRRDDARDRSLVGAIETRQEPTDRIQFVDQPRLAYAFNGRSVMYEQSDELRFTFVQSLDGWDTAVGDVVTSHQGNLPGLLWAIQNGPAPFIENGNLRSGQGYIGSAEDAIYVRFQVRAGPGQNRIRVSYNNGGGFSDARARNVPYVFGGMQTVTIPLGDLPGYAGQRITALRVEPFADTPAPTGAVIIFDEIAVGDPRGLPGVARVIVYEVPQGELLDPDALQELDLRALYELRFQ